MTVFVWLTRFSFFNMHSSSEISIRFYAFLNFFESQSKNERLKNIQRDILTNFFNVFLIKQITCLINYLNYLVFKGQIFMKSLRINYGFQKPTNYFFRKSQSNNKPLKTRLTYTQS